VDKNLVTDSYSGELAKRALREMTDQVPVVLSDEESELVAGGMGHIGGPGPVPPGPSGVV
jgi:hypothetical protein